MIYYLKAPFKPIIFDIKPYYLLLKGLSKSSVLSHPFLIPITAKILALVLKI